MMKVIDVFQAFNKNSFCENWCLFASSTSALQLLILNYEEL